MGVRKIFRWRNSTHSIASARVDRLVATVAKHNAVVGRCEPKMLSLAWHARLIRDNVMSVFYHVV